MAKIINNYVDERGVTYPSSYWRILSVGVSLNSKTGDFQFAGHRDKDARNDGKALIGTKTVFVNNNSGRFDDLYAKHLSGELNLLQIGYLLANEDSFFQGSADDL